MDSDSWQIAKLMNSQVRVDNGVPRGPPPAVHVADDADNRIDTAQPADK